MNTTEYLEASARTAPGPDATMHVSLVSDAEFIYEATKTILAIKELDAMKKALFYGKDPGVHVHARDFSDAFDPIQSMDMVHAILGIVTEAGELLELLVDGTVAEKPGKFEDELGDLMWYSALGIRTKGTTFEDIFRKNIEKLKVRFPEKFEASRAVQRDEAAEEAVFA